MSLITTETQAKKIETKAEIIIDSEANRVFDYIVPIDLSHIFKRYKRLPAVVNTSVKGDWKTPGLTRTVFFDDGTTAKESLLTVVQGKSFSYKIQDFDSSLKYLAKHIDGEWIFTDLGNGKTKIEWTYSITPKNFVACAVVKNFVLKDINVLLHNALAIIKEDLEKSN